MSKTIGQRLIERVEQAGDLSPGAFNLAADLLDIASTQAAGWTNRADDAVRIPDMLYDASIDLRRRADNATKEPK